MTEQTQTQTPTNETPNPDAAAAAAAGAKPDAAATDAAGKPLVQGDGEKAVDATRGDSANKGEADPAPAGADADEGGKGEEDADQPTVPEAYDLAMPEGMQVDEQMLEAVTPIAKELGLSNEGLQKLADAYAQRVNAQTTAALEQWSEQTTTLERAVRGDKEIGASNDADFNEKLATIRAGVGALPKESGLRQALEQGRPIHPNEPDLLRLLYRTGLKNKEDGLVTGDTAKTGPSTWANTMYPNESQQKDA